MRERKKGGKEVGREGRECGMGRESGQRKEREGGGSEERRE